MGEECDPVVLSYRTTATRMGVAWPSAYRPLALPPGKRRRRKRRKKGRTGRGRRRGAAAVLQRDQGKSLSYHESALCNCGRKHS